MKAQRFIACGKNCKCRFCPKCSVTMGVALRIKVLIAIALWKDIQMWTFTLNPEHFQTPEAGYRQVMGKRYLSRLIRELRRKKFLVNRQYFWVLEFQKNGWPHWHMILDTSFLDHSVMQGIWNRMGTGSETQNFGWVAFSKGYRKEGGKLGRFENRRHAADYITKYIIKQPENGWPEWVLDYVGQMCRFEHSRGLFAELGDEPRVQGSPVGEERAAYKRKRTVRMRVDACTREVVVYMERPFGGWSRWELPVKLEEWQAFFCLEGNSWEIPGPGRDPYVDALVWSWAGLSSMPRCTVEEGHLRLCGVDPTIEELNKFWDLFDRGDAFLSEMVPCGKT